MCSVTRCKDYASFPARPPKSSGGTEACSAGTVAPGVDNVELDQREIPNMPFLDWVNKTQAVTVAGAVPCHLLAMIPDADPAGRSLEQQIEDAILGR